MQKNVKGNREKYETPQAEVIWFTTEDVIVTSPGSDVGEGVFALPEWNCYTDGSPIGELDKLWKN